METRPSGAVFPPKRGGRSGPGGGGEGGGAGGGPALHGGRPLPWRHGCAAESFGHHCACASPDTAPPRMRTSPRSPSAHAHIHARPLCARASHSAALLRMRISPRSPSAHAHLPAPTLCACALLRAAAPAHHGRRRPLLRRLRHFFLPTWRAAMGSLSSRLLRRRGGLSLGDGAAGEGGRGGRGGGRRGGKRKRGGGEGPGDSESDSDSEREERLHSAPRRSGGGGGVGHRRAEGP